MGKPGGFTLIELLVVIAIIGLLAAMLMPALTKTKSRSQSVQCLNHQRQLTYAWILYAGDHADVVTASVDLHAVLPAGTDEVVAPSWMTGRLDFDPDNRSNWDSAVDIEPGPLWTYAGRSREIYKCPGDKSTVEVSGKRLPRVRSISMNHYAGGVGVEGERWLDRDARVLKLFRKLGDFTEPGPARTLVFLDEREDSIGWGSFIVDMWGFPNEPEKRAILDHPASYHNGTGTLSFVDGHSEVKRWVHPDTTPPLVKGETIGPVRSPGNPDVFWLQQHATVPLGFRDEAR